MRIIVSGVTGKMGAHVLEAVAQYPELTVVAGIDRNTGSSLGFPVYSDWSLCGETADVIIDFSHHSAVDSMLDYCQQSKTPCVICTTGLSEAQIQRIEALSDEVALFRSGNMSVGINLLQKLVAQAAETLYGSFDIEIVEKHHHRKVDAPSGTALMLAEAAKEAIPESRKFTYGRSGNDCKRQPEEIGIHAVRGGSIVGEHTVIFAGMDEIIELNHMALSRAVFANGAVHAARFMAGKTEGLYNMKNVLE